MIGASSHIMQKSPLLFIFITLLCSHLGFAADTRHTPKPGSSERRAICDGARAFVMKNYVNPKKLPQSLVFKIERIEVMGRYCSFEAIPKFKDGSTMGTDYVMDIVFELCMERTNDTWNVVYDLSSTDVPSDPQLKVMWRAFPKEFPIVLMPKFWRDHFNRIK